MSDFAVQGSSEKLRSIFPAEQLKKSFARGKETFVRQYWLGLRAKTDEEWFEAFIVNGEKPVNNYQGAQCARISTLYYCGLASQSEEDAKHWLKLDSDIKNQYKVFVASISANPTEFSFSEKLAGIGLSILFFTNFFKLKEIQDEALGMIKTNIEAAIKWEEEVNETEEWLKNLPSTTDLWLSNCPEARDSVERGLAQAANGQVRRRSFIDLEFDE
ncbi:MAG: hypothetical protein WA902_15560 [Thermosynechococcaceae cyanobacterium]